MSGLIIKPVGVLRTQYTEAGQLPAGRLAAARSMLAVAELDEELAAGLEGIRPGDHLWLIHYSPKAAPLNWETAEPGIFAGRKSARPNPLAISLVEAVKVEDNRLYFNYADMPDGSLLVDIRPYVATEDSPLAGEAE